MFVQQQQLHRGLSREGVLGHAHDHGDDESWSSRSGAGSSISLSGSSESISIGSSSSSSNSEPSMAEDQVSGMHLLLILLCLFPFANTNHKASLVVLPPTLPPPPPPLLKSSLANNGNGDIFCTSPKSVFSDSYHDGTTLTLMVARIRPRATTIIFLIIRVGVPKTQTMTTTATTTAPGSPASSLDRPPLDSTSCIRSVLRVSAIAFGGARPSPQPQQQQQAPPPSSAVISAAAQRSPLQHHHPNLNYSNHSNNKPPRSNSNSMTKTGNTSTSPDVTVLSPVANNTNTPTTPTTRPRLGSRDPVPVACIVAVGGALSFTLTVLLVDTNTAVPRLARNMSSGSGTQFPTTIEYRAASSSSSMVHHPSCRRTG
jgi:hypothetical protein